MTDTDTTALIPDAAVQAKRHLIQSYNWSFLSTGIDAIDDILASIADAAESYYNTSQWRDEGHIDRIQKFADVAAAHLTAPCAVDVDTTVLIKALSRLAGNRHSDGTSSLVSAEDRSAIIDGCYDLIIAAKATKTADVAAEHQSESMIICARLEGLARWLDSSQHSKWCGKKEVPIAGYSGEGKLVRSAISAIRALSPAEPAQGEQWQPIETAPRDGTPVVVYFIPNEVPSLKPLICAAYWQKSDGLMKPGYWKVFHSVASSFTATHWVPLPAAPTSDAGRAALAQGGGE